jgi:DNA-binding beta-propeller fold protein YncE
LAKEIDIGTMQQRRALSVFAAEFLLCLAVSTLQAQTAALTLTQTIPLPAVEGRIDHFAFDAAGQRLFVCALGNNSVEIIDLRKGARIHSISGLGSPQGVAYIPDLDRIFVANDQGGLCQIYDGKSYEQLALINLADDADNVRYDASAKQVYVGYGSGGLAIIDPAGGKQVGSIKLSAHPEAFQLESNGKRIFINVPNAQHVAVVDRNQGKVINRWETGFAIANFPMALDESNHRLFVGCRTPARLIVLNTDSGKVENRLDISGDVDDLFYDSRRHRVYAVCGAGKIDVLEQKNPDTYQLLTKIDTATGARTGIFVPQLDTLFVAVPHRGSQRAEIRAYHVQ